MIDEQGKTHGGWYVLNYIGRFSGTAGGSLWLCECVACKAKREIRGSDLRRGKLPICGNCCRKCGKTRNEVSFRGNKKICMICDKKRIDDWRNTSGYTDKLCEWRANNPIKKIKYRKAAMLRIQSSPYTFLTYVIKQKARWIHDLPSLNDYRSKQKAKRPERFAVTITPEFLHSLWDAQGGLCALSGMPMLHEFNNLRSVSIDRIDSNLGYVPGNVQLVCRWVNLAKGKFSNEQILSVFDEFMSNKNSIAL